MVVVVVWCCFIFSVLSSLVMNVLSEEAVGKVKQSQEKSKTTAFGLAANPSGQ
jgi:hypothetical protein